jgi:hypothetical protein
MCLRLRRRRPASLRKQRASARSPESVRGNSRGRRRTKSYPEVVSVSADRRGRAPARSAAVARSCPGHGAKDSLGLRGVAPCPCGISPGHGHRETSAPLVHASRQ